MLIHYKEQEDKFMNWFEKLLSYEETKRNPILKCL